MEKKPRRLCGGWLQKMQRIKVVESGQWLACSRGGLGSGVEWFILTVDAHWLGFRHGEDELRVSAREEAAAYGGGVVCVVGYGFVWAGQWLWGGREGAMMVREWSCDVGGWRRR
ncbi:hypothetical protein I3760_11G015700 [Carya illinoinensis]|nr:hypothetical protein I3760_11G015700 [Carya illinoinensis]